MEVYLAKADAEMAHRCDGCGARPCYRYERGAAKVCLCGHHGRVHGRVMREAGWFTYRIVELAHG